MGAFDRRELIQATSARLAEGSTAPAPGRRTDRGERCGHRHPTELSPVLLAGAVRGMEFFLVALTGFLIHTFQLAEKLPRRKIPF